VWVDENPISGMPRITLLKKGERSIEALERD